MPLYNPPGSGEGSLWGDITGTLSNQFDLQAELDGLADDLTTHEGALDPHPIYTTVPECDILYAASGHNHAGTYEPANANIQAHVAAAHAPSDAQKNSDITKAEIEAKLTGEINSHSHAGGGSPSAAWPIGSVHLSVLATNPSVLLGFGTWTAIAAGRCLVGQNSGDADFLTAEQTGGAKTHTLTTAEMPAHTHIITSQTATTGSATSYEHGTLDTSSAEAEATEVTGSSGGGGAHNNVQPYFVVHIWKRTA